MNNKSYRRGSSGTNARASAWGRSVAPSYPIPSIRIMLLYIINIIRYYDVNGKRRGLAGPFSISHRSKTRRATCNTARSSAHRRLAPHRRRRVTYYRVITVYIIITGGRGACIRHYNIILYSLRITGGGVIIYFWGNKLEWERRRRRRRRKRRASQCRKRIPTTAYVGLPWKLWHTFPRPLPPDPPPPQAPSAWKFNAAERTAYCSRDGGGVDENVRVVFRRNTLIHNIENGKM